MSDPGNDHRPDIVWEAPTKQPPPVMDYATPIPATNQTGFTFLKFFLGCIAGVGAICLLIMLAAGSTDGIRAVLVFHTIFAIGLIIIKPTRAFGIGFILGIPLSILIVFAICAGIFR